MVKVESCTIIDQQKKAMLLEIHVLNGVLASNVLGTEGISSLEDVTSIKPCSQTEQIKDVGKLNVLNCAAGQS